MIGFSKSSSFSRAASLALLISVGTATIGTATFSNDDATAPPRGIETTFVTLDGVIAAYEKTHAAASPKSGVWHWKISIGGLGGHRDESEAGDAYRSDMVIGPIHTAQGRSLGVAWSQNANGEVVTEHGIHEGDTVDRRALRHPAQHRADMELLGIVHDPTDMYVVRLLPPNGRLEYVFFDAQTHVIDRIEAVRDGRRNVTTYSDYRSTNGYTDAWHVHSSDSDGSNDEDETLQSVTYDQDVAPSSLAAPASVSPVTLASKTGNVPAKILNGDRVVIPIDIAGRTINLQLDSGAAGIVINDEVIRALRIPTYGKMTGATAGTYSVAWAIVPQMRFGDVTMHNVVVHTLPFAELADDKTPVAGLLGFDFLAGTVLHIDYEHEKVTAFDPASFTPPAGAVKVPILLDDEVPMVSALIGSSTGNHFIVDTGADRSALFSAFTNAHQSDVTDQGLGTEMQAAFPFTRDFYGVGGTVSYRPTQVGPFSFAGVTFPRWLFQSTFGAPSFEGEDFDGLIGQDVLRYFDVYLDYPHQALYFVPNGRYHDRWG